MKRLKKLITRILATTATLLFSALSPFVSASATTTSVLLGDANGDGVVDIADATCIYQYLGGAYAASRYCFTAMDINEDFVVDKTDGYIIQYKEAYGVSSNTLVDKELYTLPSNERRVYKKYDCSSAKTSTYVLNKLSEITAQNNQIDLQQIAPDKEDWENTNVVQLSIGGTSLGSGFVISKNVIATAAHCVYDIGNNNFVKNITVNVYNEQGDTIKASFEAKSYHVPQLYINPGSNTSERDNYDYALIYVDDIVVDGKSKNLLNYAKTFDIGVAAQEFMTTGRDVTVSGFTTHEKYTRYYSTGKVVDFSSDKNESHNFPNLRMKVNATTIGGKSGGVMYYTSTYNAVTHKSAVAVLTGGGAEIGTWGVRMNPTLIHFYLQNPNI